MTLELTPEDRTLIAQAVVAELRKEGLLEKSKQSLWVGAEEASSILGEGYTPRRLKELAHAGDVIAERKDPDKPTSPFIFLRSSLLEYSGKRTFDIDQRNGLKKPVLLKGGGLSKTRVETSSNRVVRQ